MTITLVILIGVCHLIASDGRLLEKRNKTTLFYRDNRRVARDVFDDDLFTGLSKEEDNGMSGELYKPLNRRPRYFFISKTVPVKIPPNVARVARESADTNNTTTNISISNSNKKVPDIKIKSVLVKKPIPKFNDIEYEDDFQIRIDKLPVKTADSVEHEDEDFNVDDYDFDINHDEFIGRGKPLEPRIKSKQNKIYPELHSTQNGPQISFKEPIKQTEKLIIPVLDLKKGRTGGKIVKKAVDKTKVDDYYDDVSSTVPPKSTSTDDDEMADENEDINSKENGRTAGRTIRSPSDFKIYYVDKFSDQAPIGASNFLQILPLFPQTEPNPDINIPIPLI